MIADPAVTLSAAEQLIALEEIKQVKAMYAYCVDTRDWDGFGQLFTLDARFDEREAAIARDPVTNERIPNDKFSFEFLEKMTSSVDWPVVGRGAIQANASAIAVGNTLVHHLLIPTIKLTSNTTAQAIWPMEDYCWFPEDAEVSFMHGYGHFHETYEKIEERWYIKTLDLTRLRVDWR